jgi:transposase
LEKNIVVSLTDPDATFARDKEKTFCFLYTSQFIVDSASLLVLGYSVSPENTDVGTLAPMIDKVQSLIGGTLKKLSVDAGYTSLLDLIDCDDRGIDLLGPVQSNSFTAKKQQEKGSQQISKDEFLWLEDEQTFQCPQGHKLIFEYQERIQRHAGRHIHCDIYRCPPKFCSGCPLKGCAKNPARGRSVRRMERQELIDAQQAKMQCEENKAAYRKRGQTVERPFADAKGHRNFGRLHGRGLRRARAEVGLLVLAQNLLTMNRLRKNALTAENKAA